MIGIDLFAGAGGMSIGAKLAGIDVKYAIEVDPHAAQTYKTNHPQTLVVVKDIRKVRDIPLGIKNKQQIVLFGGPPCQGFSISNQRTRSADNPNNWLFKEFFRLAKKIRPDWIVFENVQGILETEKGLFAKHVCRKLKALGYHTSWEVLNASQYGVPQNRSRFFLVGSLNYNCFNFPAPPNANTITVRQAISDLPTLINGAMLAESTYKKGKPSLYASSMRCSLKTSKNHIVTRNSSHIIRRFKHIPQGGNWEDIPARLMRNYTDRSRCHTGIYRRLSDNLPSVVIGNYRKNMLIHPTQDRGLSVREAARLQSFPDWFEFEGSIGFQQQQVGNAVPPLLARAVFTELLNNC